MKKLLITGCMFMLGVLAGKAQEAEAFDLNCDRSLYVAGEQVAFRALPLHGTKDREEPMSKVFYLELVSSDGHSMSRTKVLLDREGCWGKLQIPLNLPTGTYYLKGYTRWMRNWGPGAYAYRALMVLNPFETGRTSAPTPGEGAVRLDLTEELSEDTAWMNSLVTERRGGRKILDIRLEASEQIDHFTGSASLVRQGLRAFSGRFEPHTTPDFEGMGFIPEIRGASLSGRILHRKDGQAVPYAKIYISSLGSAKEFLCSYSDSLGNFYFSLPGASGELQLFISTHKEGMDSLEIALDQDFCQEPLQLPHEELLFEAGQESLLREVNQNAQMAAQYALAGNPEGTESPQSSDERYFYGHAPVVIPFSKFIRLPSLEEYFTEVTPQVSLRRERGKRFLKVVGPNPELAFHEPLLLVDGVAIFDVDALLAVSPRLVDRFEIINAPYVVGQLTFGGIIHVITTEGNLGRIDLPSSGILLDYSLGQQAVMEAGAELLNNPRIPDVRNTLYWNPDVQLSGGGQTELELAAPERPGAYELVIRGRDDRGRFLEYRKPIQVQ